MNFHPMTNRPAANSGILRRVLVSHKGTDHSSLAMIARPDTPPVTMLTGSYIFLIANPIRNVPATIRI